MDEKEKKIKKSIKSVRSWAILLLVIGILRFLVGLLSIVTLASVSEGMWKYTGEACYDALNSYLSLGIGEIVMHAFIFIFAAVLVSVVNKLRNTDLYSNDFKGANVKVLVISCIMATILLVYFIIEVCLVSTTFALVEFEYFEEETSFTVIASLVWTVILLLGGILCVADSAKVAKRVKQN